jgi:hypothetical protein
MKRRHFDLSRALCSRPSESAERIVGAVFWLQDRRRPVMPNQPQRTVTPNAMGAAAPERSAC